MDWIGLVWFDVYIQNGVDEWIRLDFRFPSFIPISIPPLHFSLPLIQPTFDPQPYFTLLYSISIQFMTAKLSSHESPVF